MGDVRRISITEHHAGGQVTTGPSSFDGQISCNTTFDAKAMKVNSALGGTTTVLSGLSTSTVSLENVNSNSLIILQPTTDVGSDQIVNFNPTSRKEGISFGVAASDTVARNVIVNYVIYEV